MKRPFLSYLLFVLLVVGINPLQAANLPAGFIEIKLAEGLDPTRMVLSEDGRIFIAQKNGTILIIENDILLEDPFMILTVDNFNERGLTGMTLHPEFGINGYFYVFYTVPGENFNRISRFTSNGNNVLENSEVVILEIDELSGNNHNGGELAFGPDGKLYISTGDGVWGPNSQDKENLNGKMIRVNEDGSIPEDNPFYNELSGKYRSIWALGLRNSFTFDFQPGTGRLFANDVGSNKYEEINDILPGKNYGWEGIEGMYTGSNPPENYQDPIHAYDHDTGCAITCGSFYNPDLAVFPNEYYGKYFFGDYCQGWIKVMDPATGNIESTFATSINRPIAIHVDNEGAMYYLERAGMGGGSDEDNTSTNNAVLWKIIYTGSGAPFVSDQPDDILLPIGEDASFSILASGANPLSYQWQKNGIDIPNANSSNLIYTNVNIADNGSTFRCIIQNDTGEITSEEATLSVTENTRPSPQIMSPTIDLIYKAGESIAFNGVATDQEDGTIDASNFTWKIDFQHDEHNHPALQSISGVSEGVFEIPQIGEIADNVWYRIYLTVEDSGGLKQTTTRDVFPLKTKVIIDTEPSGLQMYIDGRITKTPDTVTSVVGIFHTVKAIENQILGDSIYAFDLWNSDSENNLYSYFAEENSEKIIANYRLLKRSKGAGLLAQYFDNANLEGTPKITRIDPVVDFVWEDPTGPADHLDFPDNQFSIRWSGEVLPVSSGTHTFYIKTDDGVRMWIGDNLMVDQFNPQGPTEYVATVYLEEGNLTPIKIEYFEDWLSGLAQLSWQTNAIEKQIIPQEFLYPAGEIIDEAEAPLVNIFPNPSADFLNIRLFSNVNTTVDFSVYNSSGQLVGQQIIDKELFEVFTQFDLKNWATGIYLLKIKGEGIDKLLKFSKF